MNHLVAYANRLSLLVVAHFAEIQSLRTQLAARDDIEKITKMLFGNHQTYTVDLASDAD